MLLFRIKREVPVPSPIVKVLVFRLTSTQRPIHMTHSMTRQLTHLLQQERGRFVSKPDECLEVVPFLVNEHFNHNKKTSVSRPRGACMGGMAGGVRGLGGCKRQ